MNRRNFIKTGSLLISAASITKLTNLGPGKLFSMEQQVKDFSIELITNDSESAIPLIENLIKENILEKGIVKYSEYEINGKQKGDIVYFRNGELINYKNNDDTISLKLKDISKTLELPKNIENPQKIKFYTQSTISKASKFMVIQNGKIIEEVNPSISSKSLKVNGKLGYLSINIKDNKLKVTDSSCRHKTCVKTGKISRSGEYIVCIPNEIVIMAE